MTLGASVVGPSHAGAGRENEDTWASVKATEGAVIAVADGVGSVAHARQGSQAAVDVALQVGQQWLRRVLEAERIPAAVTAGWAGTVAVGEPGLRDFATTIAVAGVRSDGSTALAWLGDGLVRAEVAGHIFGSSDHDDIWDATPALNGSIPDPRWQVTEAAGFGVGDGIVLATDGVRDDLRMERVPGLIRAISDAVAASNENAVAARLEDDLAAWATPGHRDDKTIAFLLGAPA